MRSAVLVALLCVMCTACAGTPHDSASRSLGVGVQVFPVAERTPQPNLTGTTITGTSFDLADATGHGLVAVNVWASWCAPCRKEMPVLVQAAGKSLQVVGIDERDSARSARTFATSRGAHYPSLADPQGRLLGHLRMLPQTGVPSTVFLDRQGRVAARVIGPVDSHILGRILHQLGSILVTAPLLTATARSSHTRETFAAYVALTKPRIIELLLLTTLPVMFLASDGVPPLSLVVFTLVGGTLSAGSANTLNCVVDADIDAQMRRTRRRPLARQTVTRRSALMFGLVLGVVSTAILAVQVNWQSALLALTANVFYVVGYTMWLKPRTTQNIVWGGAAGCFPTLIGWTAVQGSLAWPPVVLFLVVFFWTPPHFWALAMRYREDYAAAGVPMLPVVATAHVVARQILGYALVTLATSLVLWPVANTGAFYPIAAIVLGAVFVGEAALLLHRSRCSDDLAVLQPMRLFHFSNLYLTLLFLSVALVPFVG